jgi:hypothetical protein
MQGVRRAVAGVLQLGDVGGLFGVGTEVEWCCRIGGGSVLG